MTEEIMIAEGKLRASLNEPLRYISIETDNASPQENEAILRLIEELNTQRELSYYIPIYKAAKDFVTAWAQTYELDTEL